MLAQLEISRIGIWCFCWMTISYAGGGGVIDPSAVGNGLRISFMGGSPVTNLIKALQSWIASLENCPYYHSRFVSYEPKIGHGSSGYSRRLIFWRLVRIPALFTGSTFFTYICCKKTKIKTKRCRGWPILQLLRERFSLKKPCWVWSPTTDKLFSAKLDRKKEWI